MTVNLLWTADWLVPESTPLATFLINRFIQNADFLASSESRPVSGQRRFKDAFARPYVARVNFYDVSVHMRR